MDQSLLFSFFLFITFFGNFAVIPIIATLLLFFHKLRFRIIIPLWIALLSSGLFVLIVKYLVARQRPPFPLITETGYSFPSGHAAAVFTVYPFIHYAYPKYHYLWLTFAILVAFSRVYLQVHYISDILAGAFFGYTIGALFFYYWKKNYLKRN